MDVHKKLDSQAVDKILNRVEQALLLLAGKYQVSRSSIERWHWDEPDITLSWIEPNGVGRNIHAIVDNDDVNILVEVNAWHDEDREGGKTRVRRWMNKEISRIDIYYNLERDINKYIEEAFQTVVHWQKNSLEKEEPIIPALTR